MITLLFCACMYLFVRYRINKKKFTFIILLCVNYLSLITVVKPDKFDYKAFQITTPENVLSISQLSCHRTLKSQGGEKSGWVFNVFWTEGARGVNHSKKSRTPFPKNLIIKKSCKNQEKIKKITYGFFEWFTYTPSTAPKLLTKNSSFLYSLLRYLEQYENEKTTNQRLKMFNMIFPQQVEYSI